MKMAIIGISGRMGRLLFQYFKDSYDIIGIDIINSSDVTTYKSLKEIIDKPDLIVDFSSPKARKELEYALENNIYVFSGTTGYTDEELDELKEKGKNLFYWSANYSRGINLFSKLIDNIKEEYDLFDFIEIHASTKKDAPSGTAKMLAKKMGIDYGKIQSLRINHAPPIHELIFSSAYEQITIRHEVNNTFAFIEGLGAMINEIMGE